jgi:hypothetical protein
MNKTIEEQRREELSRASNPWTGFCDNRPFAEHAYLDEQVKIATLARRRSDVPKPGYRYDPNPPWGDYVESDELLRERFRAHRGEHSLPNTPRRDRIVAVIAWTLFAAGTLGLALAWHSIAVQSFLDALRNAP